MVCQFFTCTWGYNFVNWLFGLGGGNSRKIDFILNNLYFIRLLKSLLNDDETGIATQVDLKMSTLEPLHIYWVINISCLNAQIYLRASYEKWG